MKFLFIFVFVFLNSHTPCNALPYVCDKSTVPCGCGQRNVGINARIVNGENSVPYSWSMIVSLRINSTHPSHICGGTILSESYILTAAHCVTNILTGEIYENLTIAAGIYNLSESNQIVRNIDKIIIHPLWEKFRTEIQYDIAILQLSQRLDLSYFRRHYVEYPSNDTRLIIIGWGASEWFGPATETLQQVTVQAIHHYDKLCSKTIRNPAVHLCAGLYEGGKGACNGDSGGPVFQWIGNRWEQVGIASYVEGLCGLDGSPVVFTRVAYFHDWIQIQITRNPTIASPNRYQCDELYQSCGCSRRNVVLSPSITVESENALPHTWSMIVSISLRSTNQHLCSGTILENSFILTAAHCVHNRSANELIIKAGMYFLTENDIIIQQVNGIFIHPNYTQHSNDLAILRLLTPLDAYDKDKNIIRSCLPSNDTQIIENNSSQLVVTGWNITNKMKSLNSLILQQAEIYTIDNCSVSNDQERLQFCADQYSAPPDTCSCGDPVFQWVKTRWIQVGIASHCEMTGKIGVFTNLTQYHAWIKSTLITSIMQTSQIYQCDRKASCGCSQADVNITTSGVVKTENAVENSWSMIVSIQYSGLHMCAGSILSDSFILTAATCLNSFFNTNRTTIVAGVSKLNDTTAIHRRIDQIYIHPNYSSSSLYNLAIIRLDQPLPFDTNRTRMSKTCVPMKNENDPTANTSLVVLGWNGYLSQNQDGNILQQMSVKSIDIMHPACLLEVSYEKYQFCAIPVNNENLIEISSLCSGATGGPVLMYKNNQWQQVGIITDQYRCFTGKNARIFTRLSPFQEWIKQIINSSFIIDSKSTEQILNSTKSSVSSSSMSTSTNGGNAMRNQLQNELIFQVAFLLIIIFS